MWRKDSLQGKKCFNKNKSKMTNEKEDITKLQLLQQNLQGLVVQKEQFQRQLNEIETALEEIEKTEKAYKIVGNIMVLSDKENLKKDLNEKKEICQLRIKNIERQEKFLKKDSEELQRKILSQMKNGTVAGSKNK